MAATDPGPRDHLITRALDRDLAAIARDLLEESPLDAAEAPERLARHAMAELRRELGAEDESADVQARRVNELLGSLAGDSIGGEVALPARLLQGIKGRSPFGDIVALPPLPATPFSQSDLLVNAEGSPTSGRSCGGARERRLGRSDLRVCDLVRRASSCAMRSETSHPAGDGSG